MRAHTLALALGVALLGPARGQDPAAPAWKLEVAPAGPLPEGQPVELEVTLTNSGDQPVVVLFCQASLGRLLARCPTGSAERGVSLGEVGGGVLTLTARAEEGDLGPLARAPRPPLVRPLGEADYQALQVVPPGQALRVSLPASPLAALGPDLQVVVRAATLGALPAGRAFAPQGPATRAGVGAGEPRQGGPWPGPCRVELEARVWGPLGAGEPPAEVLLAVADARALESAEVRLTQRLELTARAPSSTQAMKRAGIGPAEVEQGLFLAAGEGQPGVWLLDGPEGAFLVPPDGEAVRAPGSSLLELGRALRAGSVRLQAPSDARLRDALLAVPIPCVEHGKGLEVTVGRGDLGRLLEVLRAQERAVRGLAIVPLR